MDFNLNTYFVVYLVAKLISVLFMKLTFNSASEINYFDVLCVTLIDFIFWNCAG